MTLRQTALGFAVCLSACSGGRTESDDASLGKAATALEAKADAEVNAAIAQINAAAVRDAPATTAPVKAAGNQK